MPSASPLRVAVVMGGPSPERPVSLKSGRMVLDNLDPARYAPFAVEYDDLLGRPEAWVALKHDADFVFLALHGLLGEDGTIQGALTALGLPYYGSGVLASALAMNKIRAKAVGLQAGLPAPAGMDLAALPDGRWRFGAFAPPALRFTTASTEEAAAAVVARLGSALVVKGASQGSTLGLAMVSEPGALAPALVELLSYDHEVLIEERLAGVELTCGVVGGHEPEALPVVEIRPKQASFFDFEAKYAQGGSEEICPAPLPPEVTARVQALAVQAHLALGCWGISRSDFMLGADGTPYWLETNTLPGMTETSLIPQEAAAAGWRKAELLDRLVKLGFERPEWPVLRAATRA